MSFPDTPTKSIARKESLCFHCLEPSLIHLKIQRSKAGFESIRETRGDSVLATALGELGLVSLDLTGVVWSPQLTCYKRHFVVVLAPTGRTFLFLY